MIDATENSLEPLSQAPDLTGPEYRGVSRFGQQVIPLKTLEGYRTVLLPAQPTQCPHLVITPTVGIEEGRFQFRGSVALTHTGTGFLLRASTDVAGLEKLAVVLKGFDWEFDDQDHFFATENADKAAAVRAAIRQWQIDQGFNGPVSLGGDDDEKKAARNAAPATTLLQEQLAWWPVHYKSMHDRDLFQKNKEAWHEALSHNATSWAMTYLLAVLQRVDPTVADVAARRLISERDSGDGMGEWISQWAQEMAAGQQLTLHGIPDADPLAQFEVRS